MQWNYLLIQSPVLQSWWINYLFPNIKHLLCFASVMLGVEVSCFVVCLAESFSIALMNLRKCLMYSGYVSRLQCPPPFTHNGSYFSFESSQSRFPWDQSTISSFVPCTFIKLAGPHHPTTLKGGREGGWTIALTCITKTGHDTSLILSMFWKRLDNDTWLSCRYNTNEVQEDIYKPSGAHLENVKPKCHFDRIQYSNAWKYGAMENNTS